MSVVRLLVSFRGSAVTVLSLLILAGCTNLPTPPESTPESVDLVWPLPPEQPRISYIKSVSTNLDVGEVRSTTERLTDTLLGKPEKLMRLRKPYGVYADHSGRLFVADTGFGKLVVFDYPNKKLSFWGENGRGILSKPVGITADRQNNIYVTDVSQQRVVVYRPDGKFLRAFGLKGELESPVGIVIDEDRDRVYVADSRKHHIAVFDMQGRLQNALGERGGNPGQFNFPTNLALDKDGLLYVVDSMNFRIQILDPQGQSVGTIGTLGTGFGQFARPKGIALDSEGHIYVIDSAFNNFQIFNREGELLLAVGNIGKHAGEFWLPSGLYIDAQDRVYVADQFNFRVQVFQYLKDAVPATHGAADAAPDRDGAPGIDG